MDRLEEILQLRLDDGTLSRDELVPALLVGASVRYEQSEGWFGTRAIEVVQKGLGDQALRVCEACMAPRTFVERGDLVVQTGPVGLDEVIRLDEQARGDGRPARTAIWIEEHRGGVAIRIVDLRNGRVVFAKNVDPALNEDRNTQRVAMMSEELERRARGDSLTQAFVDIALFPGQHLSLDWTDQWGKRNGNLSGVTLSVLDPIVGVGGCHYRRTPLFDTLVGGKVIVSLPTALVRSVADADIDILDPLVTGVGVARVPFGRTNYGAVLTVSTNGQVALGISLMNINLLPVIP